MKTLATPLSAETPAGEKLLALLMRPDAFSYLILHADDVCDIVPEAQAMIGFDQCNPHHPYDAWVHTAHSVAYAPPDPLLRLTLLMHDMGKPEAFYFTEDAVGHFHRHEAKGEAIARKRLSALGFGEDVIETVATLIKNHDKTIAEPDIQGYIDELGEERFALLLDFKEADARAHDAKYKGVQLAKIAALRHS